MEECVALHDKKKHDYSTDGDRYSNFTRAAIIASWFKDDVDKVFVTMIGIKLTRLAELRNGKTPKNESRRDTSLDLTNYTALWGGWMDEVGSATVGSKKYVFTCNLCKVNYDTLEQFQDHRKLAHGIYNEDPYVWKTVLSQL